MRYKICKKHKDKNAKDVFFKSHKVFLWFSHVCRLQLTFCCFVLVVCAMSDQAFRNTNIKRPRKDCTTFLQNISIDVI